MPGAVKGYLLAVSAAVLVGWFPILFHDLIAHVQSPATAAALLIIAAWLLSLPFALSEIWHKGISTNIQHIRRLAYFILVMIVAGTLGNLFAAWALVEVLPATMQFLQRFEIIVVILLGALFLQEPLTSRLLIATVCALFGVFLIYQTEFIYSDWYSLLLPMCSGSFFAVLTIAFKKMLPYYSPMTLNSVRLLGTVLLLLLFPFFWENQRIDQYAWLLASASALTGPMGARVLYTYSFRYISVGHSVVFTTLAPLATLLIQWFWFDVLPDSYELIGGVVVMVAIIYLVAPQFSKTATQSK